jgi:hypothetical protein
MEAGEAEDYQMGFQGETGRFGSKMLNTRVGKLSAIPPSHQHTVLGPAQIRNAHGEP